MAFKTNDCQQLSFNDSFISLTEREKKVLEKSWAKIFADEIFPAIDEERLSVLYSDKASRSNTPLSGQAVVGNEKRRMRTKQDGTMNSSALQNPSGPDVTYRNKAGKQYRG